MAGEIGFGEAQPTQRGRDGAAGMVADQEGGYLPRLAMNGERWRLTRCKQRADAAQGTSADAAKLSPTIRGIAKLRATDMPSWSTSTTADRYATPSRLGTTETV